MSGTLASVINALNSFRRARAAQNMHGTNNGDVTRSRLPEADELNQAFFDYSPFGMVATDRNGRFLAANDVFCNLVGYSPAELTELTIADITHPDDRSRETHRLSIYFNSGATYESEKRYVGKDGSVRWVHVKARMTFSADPQRSYSVGFVEDISDRQLAKATKAALHESEEEFRLLFENASIGIAISDVTGGLQNFNPAFCRLTGYTSEELQDERFPSLVHPEDRTENVKQVERLKSGEIQSFEIENRYVHKNGNAIWVQKYSYLLTENSGKPKRIIALVSDVSERKERDDLIQLLMHEASHRAKNIFSVVSAVAREIAKSQPNKFHERFTERMQALAANYQLLTERPGQGVDLSQLIRSQMAHFQDLFDRRVQFGGQPLKIRAEAAQTIGMAIHELTTNASKYGALSNLSGHVKIEWRLERDNFQLSWLERGGPTAVKPKHRGFGSTVIDTMVKMGLKATVTIDYDPLGLAWNISCEAAHVVDI
jgi:PAS domain S-box-containing protein